jgi:hypothetical protein
VVDIATDADAWGIGLLKRGIITDIATIILQPALLRERSSAMIKELINDSSNRISEPRATSLRARLVYAAVFTAIALISSATPAWAIDGRGAVGLCIDSTAGGAQCIWSVNPKGEIDICTKSGCVYCPSATGDCKVTDATRPRPQPTSAMPIGSTVKTPIGTFKVTPRAVNGPLLGTPPASEGNPPKSAK